MILTTSLFTLTIHTELNLQTLKMRILQAPEHSAKRTTASIGSVFSLNSPLISISRSFPHDWMHLCLENHGKNLVSFWKGTYKGMDEGWEEYQILDHVWAVIGKETAAASNTIPALFR